MPHFSSGAEKEGQNLYCQPGYRKQKRLPGPLQSAADQRPPCYPDLKGLTGKGYGHSPPRHRL